MRVYHCLCGQTIYSDQFSRFTIFPQENWSLWAVKKKGLGATMKFLFRCGGCWQETIDYQSSQLALDSRRHVVSLALSLAFFY